MTEENLRSIWVEMEKPVTGMSPEEIEQYKERMRRDTTALVDFVEQLEQLCRLHHATLIGDVGGEVIAHIGLATVEVT